MPHNFNRRRFLACTGIVAAGAGAPLLANAISIEPMTTPLRLEFAGRCGGDINHTAMAEDVRSALAGKMPADQSAALLARVDRAPRCPLCGCPVLLSSEQPAQK